MYCERLESIPLRFIQIQDPFWSRYLQTVRDTTLLYQWNTLNDQIEDAAKSHCLENFRIAAGRSKKEHVGPAFQDTDLAKWLEAVSYALAAEPDPLLESLAEEAVDLIAACQCQDGYLNTYYSVRAPKDRWTDLREGHELYAAGHLIEAAVAYFQATGKRKLLDVACRFADLISATFGPNPGQISGYPGHQEIELALIRLYEVTGKPTYLSTARYFIEARGPQVSYFSTERNAPPQFDRTCYQDHLPVRQQSDADGHAVRAMYMYCAMADLAHACQDSTLLDACDRVWESITQRRMYLTGSIGSSAPWERFTTDYDLPNDISCSESCASIGLALFARRMAQIHQDASYMDTAELALYNTVLAGISHDGTHFFYYNPLEVWPASCMDYTAKRHVKTSRQKWFGLACCPPNIARTITNIGSYLLFQRNASLYLNLFLGSTIQVSMPVGSVKLDIDTKFPYDGTVTIHIDSSCPDWTLAIRLPGYVRHFSVVRDNQLLENIPLKNNYLHVNCTEGVSTITYHMDIPPRFVRSNPLVRANAGKVALMKGPLVYCLEENDNGANLAACFLDTRQSPKEEFHPEILGGCTTLSVSGWKIEGRQNYWGSLYSQNTVSLVPQEFTAIPYCHWNNRNQGEMCVWIREMLFPTSS